MSLFDFHTNTIFITIDVEWASPEVLGDVVRLLDERGLQATFFCTHEDINVPGHERALHPNFRRKGDTMKRLQQEAGAALNDWPEAAIYQYVVQATHAFCPEAIGVRAHSLFYDSDILSLYQQAGLEYDSTYFLPLQSHLKPFPKEYGILEIPVYYMDHYDLVEQTTKFRLEGLLLDQPGIKVFDFHPNMIFLNAATNEHYLQSKPHYHDPKKLFELRHPGRGVRTLFLELIDFIGKQHLSVMTLSEMNTLYKKEAGLWR